jgi:outer membrane protein OmpA-like peptidoglycan-associated protein
MAALPPPQLVPPLQSAVSPARPSRASPQTSGAIAVIYFADGKSALDANGRKVLGQVTQLWRLQGGNIRVLGYSGQPGRGGDLVRTAMSSLGLASARADAVAGGLAELGVPREAIESSASNDPPPMIDQGRNTGVAGTRRVEIWLDY